MSRSVTLRCADAEPYLSALADGEVAEPLRTAVSTHVATCQYCGATFARHQIVNGMIATLPDSVPSPAVLDRVLAARAPQLAVEPAQRESLRRKGRALTLRRLPALLTTPRLDPAPAFSTPRPRSFIQATALPALAALLLISFALVAFSRVAPNLFSTQTAHPATPAPIGDAYQAARAEVISQISAHPISFTAEVPWNLPTGATFKAATVDTATGSLDITWSLNAPLALLHIRESPVALSQWGASYQLLTDALTLAWQLPGKSAWRTATYVGDAARLAVVQDNTAFSIGVDVSFAKGFSASTLDSGTQTSAAANVLRLTSLSLDSTRFDMPALLPPDNQSSVLHYVLQSGSGANLIKRDVYLDAAGNRAHIAVSDSSGKLLYDDYISNGTDTRYDRQNGTYGRPTGASAITLSSAQLDGRTAAFFLDNINSYQQFGILSYVGQGKFGANSVYKLAYTTAPYLTTVYVDMITDRVVGATVDYATPQNTSAPGLTSQLTLNTCTTYVSVQYIPTAPSGTFTPPSGFTAGTPPTNLTCAA